MPTARVRTINTRVGRLMIAPAGNPHTKPMPANAGSAASVRAAYLSGIVINVDGGHNARMGAFS